MLCKYFFSNSENLEFREGVIKTQKLKWTLNRWSLNRRKRGHSKYREQDVEGPGNEIEMAGLTTDLLLNNRE